MLAHYGVDVLDPRTSLRRVHVLLSRLPPGSWPDQGSAAAWTVESHLLAGVLDALGSLTYVTLRAAGVKSATPPKPVRRPGSPQDRALAGRDGSKRMTWGQFGGQR